MAAAFPSGTNIYVPTFAASGKLQTEYSRNPKTFPVNQYCKQFKVSRDQGWYLVITPEQAARVLNSNLSDFHWADGQTAPMGDENRESFEFKSYLTSRYVYPFSLGAKSVAQADWDIMASHARISAQTAMTARATKAITIMTDTSNWAANFGTATALAGGKVDASTSTTLYGKKLVRNVAAAVKKATLGVANRDDLVMVMNPDTAAAWSESQEIVDHLKQSPFALAQVRQDVPSQNGQWGLPDVLYGVKPIIDDTVRITSKKGAASVTSGWAFPASTILFMTRSEGLRGSEGVRDFSSVQMFLYEDMTVESKSDPDNRRELGRLVDDFDVKVVAPATGYLVTSATG